jgi:hypothetical protein
LYRRRKADKDKASNDITKNITRYQPGMSGHQGHNDPARVTSPTSPPSDVPPHLSHSWAATPDNGGYYPETYEMNAGLPSAQLSEGFAPAVRGLDNYAGYKKKPPLPPGSPIESLETQSTFALRLSTPLDSYQASPYPTSTTVRDVGAVLPASTTGSQRSNTPSRPSRPASLTPADIERSNSLVAEMSKNFGGTYGGDHDYQEERYDSLGTLPQPKYPRFSVASSNQNVHRPWQGTPSIIEELNNAPAYQNLVNRFDTNSNRPSFIESDAGVPSREMSPAPLKVVKRSASDPTNNDTGEGSSLRTSGSRYSNAYGNPRIEITEEPDEMNEEEVRRNRDRALRQLQTPVGKRVASSVYSRQDDGITMNPIDKRAYVAQQAMQRRADQEKKRNEHGLDWKAMHGDFGDPGSERFI